MSDVGGHRVKVKIVVTRHVQTDAAQFKSIVQNLTGKDAVVGQGAEEEMPVADRKPPGPPTRGAEKGDRRPGCQAAPPAAHCRELEVLFMELPLLDELPDTWRND